MKTLGIDPGYGRIGFAVAEKKTGETKMSLIFSECLETDKDTDYDKRLFSVGERLEHLIKEYKPDCISIEKLFFSKNKKTALFVSEVRGACMYEAKRNGLEVFEYSPSQIKKAVAGNGSADKKQVERMVKMSINIDGEDKKMDDEYDAIAVCITHLASNKSLR